MIAKSEKRLSVQAGKKKEKPDNPTAQPQGAIPDP